MSYIVEFWSSVWGMCHIFVNFGVEFGECGHILMNFGVEFIEHHIFVNFGEFLVCLLVRFMTSTEPQT